MLKSKNKLLHKALAFVLTFSLITTLVTFSFTASALDGTGTNESPYEIATLQDLKDFANGVNNGTYANKNAVLNEAITIDASDWTPIGTTENKFTGVFDGNGKTITFTYESSGDYVGLFGINEGTIKNVTVEGSITSTTKLAFVGGVAGLNRGTIINCTNSAAISATGINSYAGGIAGVMQNGTIDDCKNSGTITVNVNVSENTSTSITDHEASAGGIVALNYNGTVKKCENTSTATISNNETYGYTGGIVGNNDGTVINCLNGGTVTNNTNTNYAGGIVGNLFTNKDTGSTATVSNCLNTNDNGEVVGSNAASPNAGTVTNSFYKADSETDDINGTTAVPETKLNSGEVTYKLNGETAANPVWGQTIGGNTLPMIGAAEDNKNIVYLDNNTYTNEKPVCSEHNYSNGACAICGDIVAKVAGYSITLDGTIGLNFYFDIKDTYNSPEVSFTIDGNPVSGITLKTHSGADSGFVRYLATVPVDSDQMNLDIIATLKYDTSSTDVVTSKPYNVNKYLNTIYSDPSVISESAENKSVELKTLAQTMSTYGFYANKYFGVYTPYETSIPKNSLEVTASNIDEKYDMTYSGNEGSLIHYGTSMQHLETTTCVFYVEGSVPAGTKMSYRTKSISTEDYTDQAAKIVDVTKGTGNYSWAATDKIPVSELKDIQFEVTFGTMTGDVYTADSYTKTYSPYGYIKTILNKYEQANDTTNSSYELVQALYHYSEAAAAYFA